MNAQEADPSTAPAGALSLDIDVKNEKSLRAPSARTGDRGRLEALLDIALEVQLEIYSYLTSQDLLQLSRACKKFRAFFLDRELNESLWLQARYNADTLPPRPPFMSEPAFIHLLYSSYCHVCGAADISEIPFGCFKRCCSQCEPQLTVRYREAREEAAQVDPAMVDIFSYGCLSPYIPVFDDEEEDDMIPRQYVGNVIDEFKALAKPLTDEVMESHKQKVRAENNKRLEYAYTLANWLEEQEDERDRLLEAARAHQLNKILARLRKEGCEQELAFMGEAGEQQIARLFEVCQPSEPKLTEEAWKNAYAALDELLHKTRRARLERDYREVLRARFDALEDAIAAHYVKLPRNARMDCRPRYIDFAFTAECKAIVDVPISEAVSAADFESAIPALAERWDAERRHELIDYILPHLGDVAVNVDPLELAIAVFKCKELCDTPIACMRYPFLLAHKCDTRPGCLRLSWATKAELEQDDMYTRLTKALEWTDQEVQRFPDAPDNTTIKTQVPFDITSLADPDGAAVAVACMRRVVRAMGLDPSTATFGDLEDRGAWLCCVTCETRVSQQLPYAHSWRSAYGHECFHLHYGSEQSINGPPQWRQANEQDMNRVKALQAKPRFGIHLKRVVEWSCALCPRFVGVEAVMVEHLATTHGIRDVPQARREGVTYLYPSDDGTGLLSLGPAAYERKALTLTFNR
ncbi:hypothetical protein BV20DRAFT_959182 [Pilatotrama ljubarskyi]|nr:hypothetical protein BV20DRAFT_959182 [Pilatotrama ljubarskyi]